MPMLRKSVTIELLSGLNRLPDTPLLLWGRSGPRSKLRPAKSPGIAGPGCAVSMVIVTGWLTGAAAPCAGEDITTHPPSLTSPGARAATHLMCGLTDQRPAAGKAYPGRGFASS